MSGLRSIQFYAAEAVLVHTIKTIISIAQRFFRFNNILCIYCDGLYSISQKLRYMLHSCTVSRDNTTWIQLQHILYHKRSNTMNKQHSQLIRFNRRPADFPQSCFSCYSNILTACKLLTAVRFSDIIKSGFCRCFGQRTMLRQSDLGA